jgi:hypothetical protein
METFGIRSQDGMNWMFCGDTLFHTTSVAVAREYCRMRGWDFSRIESFEDRDAQADDAACNGNVRGNLNATGHGGH